MNKLILGIIVILIFVFSAVGVYAYNHYCENELREVDRYAQPYIIEVMEALSAWDYSTIKPYLDSEYDESLTLDQWNLEFEKLSVLGELYSFGRPSFVKHSPYKKYLVCESAIEFYSIAAEYENANAVVRFLFDNNCGKLTIKNLAVTSEFLTPKLPQVNNNQSPEEAKKELEKMLDDGQEFNDDNLEIDLEQDELFNEETLPEIEQSDDDSAKKEIKKKAKSKSYSW